MLHLTSDHKDSFKDSALNLTQLKFAAKLECHVPEKDYTDTFKASMVFSDRVAVEAKVICDFLAHKLELETNLLATVND